MAHTSTGWQFEKLQIMSEVIEIEDDISRLVTENTNYSSENFTSDRPRPNADFHRQPSSISTDIIKELPSHQIDNALDTDDSKDVVHLRNKATNRKNRLTTVHMRKAVMSQARDFLDQTDVIDVLVKDPELNQANPESEQLRIEAIRDLHYSLSMKRSLKRQMSQVIIRKPLISPRFSALVRFKLKQGFHSFKTKIKENLRKVDFWRVHIHKVEGRFGSSTAYYFRFLQQLVALNLLIFIISCSFILVPHILWSILGDRVDIHETEDDQVYVDIDADEIAFSWSDILTGSGYIGQTELYYGAYMNESFSVLGGFTYNLPLAYLLATVCHLLLCLFLLASWVADAYKKYLSANSSYGVHTFCNLVFCSWDFTIVSQEACNLKRMGIFHDLQEKVKKYNCKTTTLTFRGKCDKYTRRLLNHLISFAAMVLCGCLTFYLLEQNTLKTDFPVLMEMTLPLVITGIFIILPVVFSIIVTWEGYEASSTDVYATLVRMMLLLMTVLGVLCYFWFGRQFENRLCWETSLGEEVYRLVLVDFFISTLLYFIVSFFRRCLPFPKLLGNSEFNLAWNTWNLIYTQMLCWLSSLYAPLISGLVLVKLILTFYLKQFHVRLNCTPPAKPWGASQAKTVFLLIAFLGLIATLIPVGYSIIAMTPSTTCGPFKNKETVYDVVFDMLKSFHVGREWLGQLTYFVTRPGCVAGIIVILCAMTFQAKAYAETNKDIVKKLEQQLILEGTDKNFLLQMLDKATQLQTNIDGTDPTSATHLPSNRRSARQLGSSSTQSIATTANGRPSGKSK